MDGRGDVELVRGLDAFAEQFRAQVDAAGAPASEHGVHFCLALGFQSAFDLRPGSVVFERPAARGRERTDLWIGPPIGAAIEVKYHPPFPSDKNRPFTQICGALLSDFNKLAATTDPGHRLVVLVADEPSTNHMRRSGQGVLPEAVGQRTVISAGAIDRLADTARRNALTHGEWIGNMTVEMIWSRPTAGWGMVCWSLEVSA